MHKRSEVVKLWIIILLVVLSGCAKEKIITYVYDEVGVEDNNSLDEVIIQVSDKNPDSIKHLTIKRYVDTANLMEQENLTFSDAKELLDKEYEQITTLEQRFGELVSLCADCDLASSLEMTGKSFVAVMATAIENVNDQSPHFGYWERLKFDFTNPSFDMKNASVKVLLDEHHLLNAYNEVKKDISVERLHEDARSPLLDLFAYSRITQINEDGMETIITQGQPITMHARDISAYEFMKVPWFAGNFVGTEFHSLEDFDNVVVPWEYCIEGRYQAQRTGYWSACTRVSLRIYDLFGEYQKNKPENTSLAYKVVETGYFVKTGSLPTEKLFAILDNSTWKAEIPTPFDLNTYRIGYGFNGIVFSETRNDGSQWEYTVTMTDKHGFYLRITDLSKEEPEDKSFTYFESSEMESLYQSLRN